MTENNNRLRPEVPSEESPNYSEKISEVLHVVPDGVINAQDVGHAASLLNRIHKFTDNPDDPGYKAYHNSSHSLNVLRRSLRLWKLFQEELPERFDDEGYKVLLFQACGHDQPINAEPEVGKDEKRSGKLTLRYLISSGYDQDFTRRVYKGIEATAVEHDEEGSIIQYNVRQGSKDPTKLVIAMADINGIPMEGVPTMFEDAINLYLECSNTSMKDLLLRPKKAVGFMLAQADFLEDRLAAMPEDIAYYFDGEERAIVQEVFDKEFAGTSRDALSLASKMKNAPDLAELAVKGALRKTKSASRIHSLPRKFGSLLMKSKDEQ